VTRGVTLSLREDVSLVEAGENGLAVTGPHARFRMNALTPCLHAAWRRLASSGASEEDLCDQVFATDGLIERALFRVQLQRCDALGLLQYALVAGARALAIVIPMRRGFHFSVQPVSLDARFQLSRFAYWRRVEQTLMIESPLSAARTILPDGTGAALLAEMATPRSCRDLCARSKMTDRAELHEETAQALLTLLSGAGVIAEVDGEDRLREDLDPPLVQWEFHDLLFHSRSRLGQHEYAFGGLFPFLGQIPPLPAVKPSVAAEIVPLYKPALALLEQQDPPFSRVLESRASVREYGTAPIGDREVGEFLYRTARVRHIREPDASRGWHYQASSRPYPSGGAAYDLELYVTVDRCTGLASGIYHYNPVAHQLHRLAGRTASVERLLRDAQHAAALPSFPQVVIILASRFQRLSWKYRGMAYATTLKNVGVLYQTMYLVATAMSLAPCALGGGDSAVFAEAVGANSLEECSVGEFILGSARPQRT
jgi:SagB-type dehydrogenase family enzyme